jgi:(2Fe-2S) ferredoxin
MPSFRRHVFVCTNERDPANPRGCCKAKGAVEVRARFKSELGQRGMKTLVRANNAGCLDQCEHGVTVVVYPEQVWYGGVTPQDVPELIERHIIRGEFVQRLMIPGQPHLAGARSAGPLVAADEPAPPGAELGAKRDD